MKNKILILLIIIVGIYACEEPREWELESLPESKLVVEAILTDELIIQEIQLTKSFDVLNADVPTVEDAFIKVEVNGTMINFWPDTDSSGVYKSEIPFAVVDDLEYELTIDWKEKTYSANSRLSEIAPLPMVTFEPYLGTDSLIFGDFIPLFNANQQAMIELNVNWSHLINEGETSAKMVFYTFNTLDVSQIIRPPIETVPFPKGSIVTIKKFGLNDDFAEYLRALAIETDWSGAFFYSAPENLPSNINNGALGFFSTCAVVSDTLIAE